MALEKERTTSKLTRKKQNKCCASIPYVKGLSECVARAMKKNGGCGGGGGRNVSISVTTLHTEEHRSPSQRQNRKGKYLWCRVHNPLPQR